MSYSFIYRNFIFVLSHSMRVNTKQQLFAFVDLIYQNKLITLQRDNQFARIQKIPSVAVSSTAIHVVFLFAEWNVFNDPLVIRKYLKGKHSNEKYLLFTSE